MKIAIGLALSCICIQQQIQAQDIHAKQLVSNLFGKFEWQMKKPSVDKIIRKGTRVSEPYFDGTMLFFKETFFDSNIEQVGFFGYDAKNKTIFSIGLYNVDIGPHVLKGTLKKESQGYSVRFFEGDKQIVLQVENEGYHYWEYYSKQGKVWSKDDLQIDFYRQH